MTMPVSTSTLTAEVIARRDGDSLAREITLLAGQINAATHRLLKLIAEFDNCKGYSGGGTVRSCAHWLNWQCGIALGAAREKVRVAHCLEELPLIDAAFARGEISYSKVRAMTRVATAETEDYLLMIAKHGTASHVEKVVSKYKAVRRALDGKAESEQIAARELLYYQDEQGMWVIHARLPAEAGELVVKAIEASVALEREQGEEREEAENVPAETFSDEQQRPTLPQARADALEHIVEQFVAAPGGPAGLKGSDRCQIQLHISLPALQGASDSSPLRRLCCDAGLVTVLEDDQGRVLNIGRRSRTVPPAIRRALDLRDNGTCRVPGCCESRYIDAHHIVHWADGGETSLDNLVTLCRHHHRALHNGVFSVEACGKGPERNFVFHTSDGESLSEGALPHFADACSQTFPRKLFQLAPEVAPRTCVPHWQGERCDYSMAVEGLLGREGLMCLP